MGQKDYPVETLLRNWAVFSLPGLCCPTCVEHVDCTLRAIQGVSGCRTDVRSRCTRVDYDGARCGLTELIAAINRVGYQVEKVLDTGPAAPEPAEGLSELPSPGKGTEQGVKLTT